MTQASLEERLELVLRDRDKGVCILSPLVLLPAEANPVPEEEHGKKNLRRLRNSSSSKVVLGLLTEGVKVHVGLPTIYVRETGLQLLPRRFGNNGS